mgnify:CR=1 FL=1
MELVLKELMDDIGTIEEHRWVFISNRKKGIVKPFKEVLPDAEHELCMRHMYDNFKKKFKGLELKDAMWKATSSTTLMEFKGHM